MQQLHVDYFALRPLVQDGDTIALRATGAYAAALSLGAMAPYGHVGMARKITTDGVTRLMVIEENPGGGRIRPLSHYHHLDFDVYSAPKGICGHAASCHAINLLDGLEKYDWSDAKRLAAWGIKRFFARLLLSTPPEPANAQAHANAMVCNAFVTAAYKAAGWAPQGTCAWPSALTQQLGKPRYLYRPNF